MNHELHLFQQMSVFCCVQNQKIVLKTKILYYNFNSKSSVGIMFGLTKKYKRGFNMEKKENFLKKAFKDMGESAKAQAKVDKANLQAVKAESRANFEENRGTNTLKKAKAQAKQSWDDAHLSPAERTAKVRAEQEKQIEEANERIRIANERYNKAKVEKKK